jgi:hypothetical protein
MTAASNEFVANGSAIASPLLNSATRAAGRCRTKASCASDGSTPLTPAGAHRSMSNSVNVPLPQPISTHRIPERGASQSRKIVPASRLQMPIHFSYAAPSSKRIWSAAIKSPLSVERQACLASRPNCHFPAKHRRFKVHTERDFVVNWHKADMRSGGLNVPRVPRSPTGVGCELVLTQSERSCL